MEALQSGPGVITSPGPKDKPPVNGHLVMVEVETWLPKIQIDSHLLVEPGVHPIAVTPQRVDTLLELVETRFDAVEGAKEAFEHSLADDVYKESIGSGQPVAAIAVIKYMEGDSKHGIPAERLEWVKERLEYHRENTGNSWQAEFYGRMRRSPLPLKSVEVIDERVPYAEHVQKAEADRLHVEALAQGIAVAIKGKKG